MRRSYRSREFVFLFFGGLGFGSFGFDFLVHGLRVIDDVFAEGGYVQRVFVGGIGFGFGNGLRSAYDFLNGRFFGRLLGVFFIELDFFLVLFFDLIFLEDGATGRGVGFDFFANEVLLGVDDAGGENACFFVADGNVGSFGSGRSVILRVDVDFGRSANFLFLDGRGFGSIGRGAGKKPAGQATA